MSTILSSTIGSSDQEKFLGLRLIQRSQQRLVCASVFDKLQQPKGSGLTANFVRYERMYVPLEALSEGTDPDDNSFELTPVTVTLDQWGDVLRISDIAQLATSHDLMEQCVELLSDVAMRIVDREVQIVLLAGTNVQYGDGSVTARSSITSSMKPTDNSLHQLVITLEGQGAPKRGGPAGGIVLSSSAGKGEAAPSGKNGLKALGSDSGGPINQGLHYVAICGPQLARDIQVASTSIGSWASVSSYQNAKALYAGEVGEWLGLRIVVTNFIPQFRLLGSETEAVATGNAFGTDTPVVTAVASGGDLKSGATYFYKVTRKSKLKGFEEYISVAHSTAAGAGGDNESFTFNFTGLTEGYVYNLYFDDTVDGGDGTDANLRLHTENIEVGTTVTVTTEQLTGSNPPTGLKTSSSQPAAIHPMYVVANEMGNWVGLQDLRVMISGDTATTDNPLLLRKTVSFKFMGKAMIRDQYRLIRGEFASAFNAY